MRSQLFLKTLNCLKYGKNDQRVTPEPLMRKHKTGSAKHGGIVQIAHQRSSIRAVADFKAITCPPTQNFIKCINLKFITSPAIALIQCCAIVLSFLFSVCVGKDTLFDKLWLVRLDCAAWQCVWL